ncbi:MAG: hypothetical protein V1922_04740 [bacterium]
MQKIALITGSESFGKYVINPAKWLALAAEGKTIAGHKIVSLVFPTTTLLPNGVENPGTTIVNTAIKIKANVIISFGLASEAKGFRIERSGYNWIENIPYCQPYENFHSLDTSRPAKEQIQIDMSQWNMTLLKELFEKNKLPLDPQISDDPGRFSCNSWIYRTLVALKKVNVKTPYLFIHSACTEEAVELIPDFPRNKKIVIPKKYLLKALEILLQSYV